MELLCLSVPLLVRLIEVTLYYQSYYSTKIRHKKSSLSNPDPV